jgi:hypothetical protein
MDQLTGRSRTTLSSSLPIGTSCCCCCCSQSTASAASPGTPSRRPRREECPEDSLVAAAASVSAEHTAEPNFSATILCAQLCDEPDARARDIYRLIHTPRRALARAVEIREHAGAVPRSGSVLMSSVSLLKCKCKCKRCCARAAPAGRSRSRACSAWVLGHWLAARSFPH